MYTVLNTELQGEQSTVKIVTSKTIYSVLLLLCTDQLRLDGCLYTVLCTVQCSQALNMARQSVTF